MNTYAAITDNKSIFRQLSTDEIITQINEFLSKNNLNPADIDVFLTGVNGDCEKDRDYYKIVTELFPSKALAYYKHLCGEYFTSPAFALWLAANIIKNNSIPSSVSIRGTKPASIKHILFYNRFNLHEHSLMLISAAV
jgi:hypothetical protein